ncbi:MAG TPA: PQQ-dependent dehydrogenase, methanol/ethanol family [Gemmatimonadaceae bacterium]|nr:PQQ-dependent dehydrogenase, methanol/ethanol family [Gemmatimonadaceae bacterium]
MERLISWRGPVVVALAAIAGTLGWSTSSRAQSPRAAQLVDAAARGGATTSSVTTGSATTGRPTTGSARPAEPPGDSAGTWVSPGKSFGATRYSPLDQITSANVNTLKEVWSYITDIQDGHEGQPLVVNGTMYIVTPYPDKLIAFDLSKPGPAKKWEYDPPINPVSFGKACCDDVNRGATYASGLIVFNTLDDHTVAVNATTGKLVWRTTLGDPNTGETITMAPIIADGKVIVGDSGGEMGVWGWIAGLDLKSGKLLWRARSTGADKDVLIGPNFKPYYGWMQGKDLGLTSWRGQQWKIGGSAVWGWISYDPELNLIYYGTSNPGVWNPDMRPGDNLWSTTIFARNPDTGEARWAYQLTPHDRWDYDAVNENILADLPMDGTTRKVLVHFDRNGFAYTIDRATGQVLVAQPFKTVNWASKIDLTTGRPVEDTTRQTHQGHLTKDICPSSTGAKDQQPAAYSPDTHLFYTPSTNICMDYGGVKAKYIAGTPYVGAAVKMYAGPGGDGARGEFLAWDAATGRKVWGITERFPVWSGALVTAGGVVFYGTLDGDFKAVDAKTGKPLWKTHFKSGIVGNPITYTGPDGKQYIAIYSGVGGWMGAIVPGHLSPDDPWAALGAVGAVPDLPQYTAPGGALHVFALP